MNGIAINSENKKPGIIRDIHLGLGDDPQSLSPHNGGDAKKLSETIKNYYRYWTSEEQKSSIGSWIFEWTDM